MAKPSGEHLAVAPLLSLDLNELRIGDSLVVTLLGDIVIDVHQAPERRLRRLTDGLPVYPTNLWRLILHATDVARGGGRVHRA